MKGSIFLVILTLIIAAGSIFFNPKKDREKLFYKPSKFGYFLIAVLVISSVIQIKLIDDERKEHDSELNISLMEKEKDSIEYQRELVWRDTIISKNNRLLSANDSTINLQKDVVRLQNELLEKSRIENLRIQEKLNLVEQKSDRSNNGVKNKFDIVIMIPLDNYSVARRTENKIPLITRYFNVSGKRKTIKIPDIKFFTDSLCQEILKQEFGNSVWLEISILKPDGVNFIRTTCGVGLASIDTINEGKFFSKWYANFDNVFKGKNDSINLNVISTGNDIWWLKLIIKEIPLKLVYNHPRLAFADLTNTGTLYKIKYNSHNTRIYYEIIIKDEYNSFVGNLNWMSKKIFEDNLWRNNVAPFLKDITVESYFTETYATVENTAQWTIL